MKTNERWLIDTQIGYVQDGDNIASFKYEENALFFLNKIPKMLQPRLEKFNTVEINEKS